MDFRINLKKLMKENDLSLYKLDKICDLCINTLRSLINNPSQNTNLRSLSILAQVLDCSIKDLIEDNPIIINYENIAEKNKDRPLYCNNQVFSPKNIEYLRKLLLQVGVSCKISPYNRFRTANVKNEYELSSIKVDFNLRVLEIENKPILQIINFYISVNQVLLNEAVIKDAFIKALEIYARYLLISEIRFKIDQDFERQNDPYSNSHSELPANFSYTLGTESILFTQNNYECYSSAYLQDLQNEWRKILR